MKVLFIRSKVDFADTGFQSRSIMKNFGVYPPVGLCQIASVARTLGHEVCLIDALAENIDFPELIEKTEDYAPDIICFSLWSYSFKSEIKVMNEIKKNNSKAKIVVGGPHIDLYAYETLLACPAIDIAVKGEGEETFKELVEFFSNDLDLKNVNGLFYRMSGNIIENLARPKIENLDSIPFPAIDLLDLQRYFSIVATQNKPVYILTSRGCPFKCSYCVDQQFGRSVRFHSPDYLIQYFKWLTIDLGVNEIHFFDDTFTLNKERTLEICRRIIEENLSNTSWTIRTRVDTVDDDILDMLSKAGCYRIGYGVESGSQRILDSMNRGVSLEKIRKTFKLTKKYPFETVANFMIGYLGENKATYKDTINLAIELDPDFAYFSITQVIPYSELYYQALRLSLIKDDEYKDFVLGKSNTINIENYTFNGEDYPRSDLRIMQAFAYVKFYLRFKKILHQIKKTKTLIAFYRKIKMADSMIYYYIVSVCNNAVIKIKSQKRTIGK